jgi:hypothetical protein
MEEDWASEGERLIGECITVVDAVISRYQEQGDSVSAAVLARGAGNAFGRLLGDEAAQVENLFKLADSLRVNLSEDEKNKVTLVNASCNASLLSCIRMIQLANSPEPCFLLFKSVQPCSQSPSNCAGA